MDDDTSCAEDDADTRVVFDRLARDFALLLVAFSSRCLAAFELRASGRLMNLLAYQRRRAFTRYFRTADDDNTTKASAMLLAAA